MLSRSTRGPLITYLLAEIAWVPLGWLAWMHYGPGMAYGRIWAGAHGLILLAVAWIAWDALRTRQYRLRPLVLAGMLAFLFAGWTWSFLREPTWFDWVNLADGATMLLAGVVLAYTAPYNKLSTVHLVLGSYWLIVALYDFLFVAGFTGAYWLPQILELVAFGLIFRLLRVSSAATA